MARKIGYLGPPGTFGEQAALLYAPDAELVELVSHTSVVKSISEGALVHLVETGSQVGLEWEAIAAVENSLEGAVNETMDALLATNNVFIRGEIVLPIEHNLIAAPGQSLQDIKVVKSHPQALGQCQLYLRNNLPDARLEAALSTAGAVESAVQTPGVAGIGTRRAAEIFGGEILAASIQDADNNKTRFLVLGLADAEPTGDDKTSIAFEVPDRPGSLVEALMEFSSRGINLTRIESRPSREQLGKYVFLIDFQGHRLDAKPAEALEAIRRKGAGLLPADRPLGSYPRFVDNL